MVQAPGSPAPPGGQQPQSITGNPEIDRRVFFYENMIRQIDTNQDGMVSPDELSQSRMGSFLSSRLSERFGVDVSRPFRIDDIRQKVVDYYSQRESGQSQQGQSASPSRPSSGTTQPQVQQVTILRLGPNVPVPGFGVPSSTSSGATATVPGFGSRSSSGSTVSSSGSPSSNVTSTSVSQGGEGASVKLDLPPPAPLDERIRRYAESLMRQYDENRNGKLEKEEWAKMRGSDWPKADQDGDGELTLEEIGRHLAAESGQNSSRASQTGPTPVSTRSGKRFIQRDPWDRLPADIPSWFKERDKDRDGQVMMAEFTERWTADKLREFQKYDLNGDGVITAEECLKAK